VKQHGEPLPVLVSSVPSGEVVLAVREFPHPDARTVMLVHGLPDTQRMWEPLARRLQEYHHLRVVTYDTRGAGGSTAPSGRTGYRTERLVDDLVAVLDATAPDAAVHLVGHDWGSVQLWEAVNNADSDPRLRDRICSFTSISGPALDYLSHVLREAMRRRDLGLLRSQARKSWYVCAFQVPWLPELAVRRLGRRMRAGLKQTQRLDDAHWADTFDDDAANGINLYRANVGRMRVGQPRGTRIPVQLVVPEFDPFLDDRLFDQLADYVSNVTRVDVRAGHWVPRTHADLVARLIADHISAQPNGG
jgi:pimeloyl-ACP methyl ester carboxylesterase